MVLLESMMNSFGTSILYEENIWSLVPKSPTVLEYISYYFPLVYPLLPVRVATNGKLKKSTLEVLTQYSLFMIVNSRNSNRTSWLGFVCLFKSGPSYPILCLLTCWRLYKLVRHHLYYLINLFSLKVWSELHLLYLIFY